jgi:WD40 repeat protein
MLIQPFKATGQLLSQRWSPMHTAFTGDNERGFLASLSAPAEEAIPELRIYALPNGKLLDQFPLVRCPGQMQDCPFGDAGWWEIYWSPDGRYLAFPAIWDDPSTDLYIYDIESGKTRQLTSGPEDVEQIWWSPDGRWIVMGETKLEAPFTSSLWAISIRGDEPRLLYSLEHPFPQGIVGWVDDHRLIVFDGTTLSNVLDLPAEDLRLVDIRSGEITTLFAGLFYGASIDKTSQTLAVYAGDVRRAAHTHSGELRPSWIYPRFTVIISPI